MTNGTSGKSAVAVRRCHSVVSGMVMVASFTSMSPALFRAFLLFSVVTGLLGGFIDGLCPALIPEPLAAAWDNQPPDSLFAENTLVAAALFGSWLIATVVSTVGLFFFRRWARPLALLVTALGLLATLLFGPSIASGWSSALIEASTLAWGAALALAYSSPIAEQFVAKRITPSE